MKVTMMEELLVQEHLRFTNLAREAMARALHKSADGRSINELDARLIRDHEIRAETFKAAARLIAS